MIESAEPTFQEELSQLINKHSLESGSDTPDFILALYLRLCLSTFDSIMRQRERYRCTSGRKCTDKKQATKTPDSEIRQATSDGLFKQEYLEIRRRYLRRSE
jgi:hypothetical protein